MKFLILTTLKNLCKPHGQVFVMVAQACFWHLYLISFNDFSFSTKNLCKPHGQVFVMVAQACFWHLYLISFNDFSFSTETPPHFAWAELKQPSTIQSNHTADLMPYFFLKLTSFAVPWPIWQNSHTVRLSFLALPGSLLIRFVHCELDFTFVDFLGDPADFLVGVFL